MKKITLLLMAVLAWVGSVSAQDAQSPVSFNWAHSVDGATDGGDNVLGVVKATDGDYFVASTFGTTNSAMNVKFDGETLLGLDGKPIEGSPYQGTSMNANLLLQKVSNTGSVVWNLYSKKGYIFDAQFAATADGGIVAVVKTRAWVASAGLDNLLEIVDGTGATTTIKDMWTSGSEYRFLILKIDANGKLVWSRLAFGDVEFKNEALSSAVTVKDNAKINTCAVDEAGNVYLAGNLSTSLYFKKEDGTLATLVSKNNSKWDGKASTNGDLFLVKLDANGYFVNSLSTDGTAKLAMFDKMVYNGGKLYLDGRVQSDGTVMKVGGKEVAASTTTQTQILASVNTSDLSVNYVNVLPSEGAVTIQNKNAQFVSGKVYFTGIVKGTWLNGSEKLVSTTALNGYVLEMDPATGNISHAVTSGNGIFGIYANDKSLYAFGYAASKAVLTPINVDTWKAETAIPVCTYGTIAIMGTPAIDGDNLVMMTRGGKARSNVDATFAGTDKTFSLYAWGVVYFSYNLNPSTTDINSAKVNADSKAVDVYTTDGIFVKKANSLNEAKQGLAKGIYIFGNQKFVIE